MYYQVIMSRTDQCGNLTILKEYHTKIPIEIIVYLSHIEKRDWILFRDSPYNMFGRYLYHNLTYYPKLIPYINKHNCNFEFIYEYIIDCTQPIHTQYHYNHLEGSYYFERWIIKDLSYNKTFIFFECEYNPLLSNFL